MNNILRLYRIYRHNRISIMRIIFCYSNRCSTTFFYFALFDRIILLSIKWRFIIGNTHRNNIWCISSISLFVCLIALWATDVRRSSATPTITNKHTHIYIYKGSRQAEMSNIFIEVIEQFISNYYIHEYR